MAFKHHVSICFHSHICMPQVFVDSELDLEVSWRVFARWLREAEERGGK